MRVQANATPHIQARVQYPPHRRIHTPRVSIKAALKKTTVASASASGITGAAATWLLLAAFLLLCFEWVLFRTERIP